MRRSSVPTDLRTMDGIEFDSLLEMHHYANLKILQRAGKIEKLQHEPLFRCIVNDVQICTYRPDFTYLDAQTQALHVEDVKGWRKSKKTGKLLPRVNREFGMKVKLMRACFGITVELV